MENIMGVEVTRPYDILIILRGIPGSGKSTISKKLVKNGVIHSTDDVISAKGDYHDFFKRMKTTGNFSPLGKAHAENNNNIKRSIDNGVSPVIVDNTNIKPNEPKEVVEYALKSGYSDDNIEFLDIGTRGMSAEELANNNTHGVPLDKIKKMISSYESTGPLTLQKVVKAKPIRNKRGKKNRGSKKFASVVLDRPSMDRLYSVVREYIPEGWELSIHHMTINFGKGLGPEREGDLGKTVELVASEIGISDMAVAVKVHGYPSDNNTPHITIAYNKSGGGKPIMSNYISNWERLGTHINLRGIVTEKKLN